MDRSEQTEPLIIEYLKEIPWFNSLETKYGMNAVRKIVKKLKLSNFTSVQLLEQSDFVDRLFILLRGRVKVNKFSHFGNSHDEQKTMGPGDVFGDSNFESENKSNTFAHAIREVHLLSLLKVDYRAILCKSI
jgi:CRP-like cAMP-binding protein